MQVHRSLSGPRRPARVLALTGVLGGAAASLLVAVLFPVSDQAPVGLGIALIPVALAMAAGTYVLGPRLPPHALLAEAAVAAAINAGLVTAAHTTAGVMGDAFAFVWLVAYVAAFFPRAALPFTSAVVLAFAAAAVAAEPRVAPGLWAIAGVTLLVLGAIVAQAGRVLHGALATDDLTGALNRRGLRHAAAMRRRRRDRQLAVAVLDLDGFKAINDRHGHASGDALLADAAAAWQQALRADDVLARTGGDEFVVLMPDTSEREAAAALLRLRQAHPARWSAGVAAWQADEPLDAALARADAQLYRSKRDLRG
jgi:diguanylate cyclase (GGDEF)-like protein